jgi:Domain of Unknown Function (DUF928)
MLRFRKSTPQAIKIILCLIIAIAHGFALESPGLSKTPPPSGRPGRTAAGGHRGQCPKVAIPLTAIVPLTEATTIAPRPTFWFYSPYTDITWPAKFTIQSKGDPITEPISVRLPTKPGIIRVSLPDTVTLEVNQPYEWFFAIDCNPGQTDQPPIEVEGTVRRVNLTATQLAKMTKNPRQQVGFYTANGLWLDAVTTLSELRLAAPQDATLTAEWQTLLRSLDLEQFAQTPVVASTTPRAKK